MGADTTLMVWADLDHDMEDGDALKAKFREVAENGESQRKSLTKWFLYSPRIDLKIGLSFSLMVRRMKKRKAHDKSTTKR